MTPFPVVYVCAALSFLGIACGQTREISVLERKQQDEDALAKTNPPRRAISMGDGPPVGWYGAGNPSWGAPSGASLAGPITTPVFLPCRNDGYCRQLSSPMTTGIDLLFVIDNSNSMAAEQAALREQFPRLVRILTSGEREDGSRFEPAHDLHLGVVSTDMGVVGVRNSFPGCLGEQHYFGGDDGVLQHRGSAAPDCESSYPAFLQYREGTDPEKLARDFGCIANLGTAGCGFEQPLEAALKALWPMTYKDANNHSTSTTDNPVQFLSVTREGAWGHGDVLPSLGGNGGFARNDPAQGMSLLAIIVVTDEDDCSARDADLFRSTNDPADPLSKQPIPLRCHSNPEKLYPLERYALGLQYLRPHQPDSVRFGVIAGVPPDLVDRTALEAVDFADAAERDAYYARILGDERMQERVSMDGSSTGLRLAPSCTRNDASGQVAEAMPPRRLVEVAKRMGKRGRVQSICQDDFGPAVDGMIDMMAQDPGAFCVSHELPKRGRTVDCEVVVELEPRPIGPADCGMPYLRPIAVDEILNPKGFRCVYDQAFVEGGRVVEGEGFFYDDFSEAASSCDAGSRIAFTQGTEPPPGRRVYIDCRRGP